MKTFILLYICLVKKCKGLIYKKIYLYTYIYTLDRAYRYQFSLILKKCQCLALFENSSPQQCMVKSIFFHCLTKPCIRNFVIYIYIHIYTDIRKKILHNVILLFCQTQQVTPYSSVFCACTFLVPLYKCLILESIRHAKFFKGCI